MEPPRASPVHRNRWLGERWTQPFSARFWETVGSALLVRIYPRQEGGLRPRFEVEGHALGASSEIPLGA
jgi:hypothetical protein